MSWSSRRLPKKGQLLQNAVLLLACFLSLQAASFVASGRHQRRPEVARASQSESDPQGTSGSVIVASRDAERQPEAPRSRGARLQGTRAKPGPVQAKPSKPEEPKFPLAAAGAAALAAVLFALSQGSSPQADGMPRDAYYVSSSSYVIQSVRDESGQLRTKVDENRGLWTNIPGLKGGQRSSSSEADQRLREAQQEMRQTQAQVDKAMDEMNQAVSLQDLPSRESSSFEAMATSEEMASVFGSPMVALPESEWRQTLSVLLHPDYEAATTCLLDGMRYTEPLELLQLLRGVLAEVIKKEEAAAESAKESRAKRGSGFSSKQADPEVTAQEKDPKEAATRRWRRTLRAVFNAEAAMAMLGDLQQMYKSEEFERAARGLNVRWRGTGKLYAEKMADIEELCLKECWLGSKPSGPTTPQVVAREDMPRRRRSGATVAVAATQVTSGLSPTADDEERSMRTQVFEKTKMCKFHILGACTKGSSCRFAHSQSELQCLPDLACTKLCKTLIATGGCDNPDCRYAHSQEELRPLPFPDVEREQEMRHFELPLAAGEVRPGVRRSSSAMSMSALQKDKAYQTFMQIGQAAQAHAAEARRLHAAAAEIQAAHLADDAPYYMNQMGLDTMSMHGQEECGPQDCMDCAWAGNATEPTNAQSLQSLSLRLQAWRRKPRKAIRALSAGWVDACKTLQALLEGDVQTNVYHFNAVLGAVGRTQRWPRALQMLCSMLRAETADLVSLNTVIHAGEKKQWQMAHSILCLLHDLGGVPNAISYNSCISACYGVAWPRALQLADSMVSCATALGVITCNNVARVCGIGDWRRSAAFVQKLTSKAILPDAISYNTVANSLEDDRWSWALGNLPRMRRSALRPSAVSLGTLMKLCEDWELAFGTLAFMRSAAVPLTIVVSGSAIAACFKQALWTAALQQLVARGLHDASEVVCYNAAMTVCGQSQKWRAGLRLFQRMGQCRQAESAITKSVFFLVAGERLGRWRQALDRGLCRMKATKALQAPSRIIACSSALGACEDSERWAEALVVLQGMRADGLLPNVFSYSSAISALEKRARWVLSLHLLDQMEAQGVAPNEISYSGAVGACEKAVSGPAAGRSQTP
ncbi:Rf1 [Symbiodinium sp. CCMP2592]|nr:Rf1 [Symbiodinium sp. CCMP2592]